MLIQKNFEQWLQQINSRLRIMTHATNKDIDVLYYGKKRLCSIPKGLKSTPFWTNIINDDRLDSDYETSDGIAHRSLVGIGAVLLKEKIITLDVLITKFTSGIQKDHIKKLMSLHGEDYVANLILNIIYNLPFEVHNRKEDKLEYTKE